MKTRDLYTGERERSLTCPSGEVIDEALSVRMDSGAILYLKDTNFVFSKAYFLFSKG